MPPPEATAMGEGKKSLRSCTLIAAFSLSTRRGLMLRFCPIRATIACSTRFLHSVLAEASCPCFCRCSFLISHAAKIVAHCSQCNYLQWCAARTTVPDGASDFVDVLARIFEAEQCSSKLWRWVNFGSFFVRENQREVLTPSMQPANPWSNRLGVLIVCGVLLADFVQNCWNAPHRKADTGHRSEFSHAPSSRSKP